MKVLSLFDGISCGRIALDKLGIDCEYHAYEIDERAKLVSKSNYPNSHYYSDVFQCDGNKAPIPISPISVPGLTSLLWLQE